MRAEAAGARTWLLSIARRAAVDAVRGASRRRRLIGLLTARTTTDGGTVGLADGVLTDHALALLDVDRRVAFTLTQLMGFDYAGAAEVCGCPIGTIRSRVARAREQLVAELSEVQDMLDRVEKTAVERSRVEDALVAVESDELPLGGHVELAGEGFVLAEGLEGTVDFFLEDIPDGVEDDVVVGREGLFRRAGAATARADEADLDLLRGIDALTTGAANESTCRRSGAGAGQVAVRGLARDARPPMFM